MKRVEMPTDVHMMRPEMPIVHLNGTSGEDLLKVAEAAERALYLARDAVNAMYPNARDYYVKGPDAFKRAAEEHAARVDAIGDVLMEVSAITADLQEQMETRSRQKGGR